jgi:hypothetical protein
MPSDFAFYYLTRPFGICLQFALLFLPVLLLRAVAPVSFRKIGLLRFALGYAAVSLATVGLAFFKAFTLGRSKVALGHIPADSLVSWVGSSTIYLFVLIFIFTLVFTSLVVAPVTIWFASRNRATLPAVVAIGIAAAVLVAALAVLFPANEWASTHRAGEFFAILSSVGVGIVLVPLAFGLGAGLPIRRSTGENAT